MRTARKTPSESTRYEREHLRTSDSTRPARRNECFIAPAFRVESYFTNIHSHKKCRKIKDLSAEKKRFQIKFQSSYIVSPYFQTLLRFYVFLLDFTSYCCHFTSLMDNLLSLYAEGDRDCITEQPNGETEYPRCHMCRLCRRDPPWALPERPVAS